MSKDKGAVSSSERFDRHARLVAARFQTTATEATRKFLNQRVFLAGDAKILGTRLGRLMLFTAANLISRFCPKIDIALPPSSGPLGPDLLRLLQSIDGAPHADFRVVGYAQSRTEYAAILSVGPTPLVDPRTTTIESYGWLAAVSRAGILQSELADQGNPFGALMAASLGAAEVFKYLLEPLNGNAFHFGDTTFSTFDYCVGTTDPGPTIPNDLVLPHCLLAGVGALGNAIALSLSEVRSLRGALWPVDRQAVDSTNLNRHSLALECDADPNHPLPKTQLVSRAFQGSQVRVEPHQEELGQFLEMMYKGQVPRPEIVLSAVDNNDAREELQMLWPTLLLDGSTSETLSQAFRFEYGSGGACLMCIHTPARGSGVPYAKKLAKLSGLSEQRIRSSQIDPAMVVTQADVDSAPSEKRAWLQNHVGQSGCSVLSELEHYSQRETVELPTEPAVSFVSMNAGILVAGELIKWISGMASPLDGFFQLDAMVPLSNSALQPLVPASTCYCGGHQKQIEEYRARRKAS